MKSNPTSPRSRPADWSPKMFSRVMYKWFCLRHPRTTFWNWGQITRCRMSPKSLLLQKMQPSSVCPNLDLVHQPFKDVTIYALRTQGLNLLPKLLYLPNRNSACSSLRMMYLRSLVQFFYRIIWLYAYAAQASCHHTSGLVWCLSYPLRTPASLHVGGHGAGIMNS